MKKIIILSLVIASCSPKEKEVINCYDCTKVITTTSSIGSKTTTEEALSFCISFEDYEAFMKENNTSERVGGGSIVTRTNCNLVN